MKLTDRAHLFQTRYSQSFGQFANRTKILNSTAGSHTVRLPQLSRSFSSSSKNNMQKMTDLDGNLRTISNSIRDLRLETRQSKRYCNFLTDDMIERRLNEHKNNLIQQINGLDKLFKVSKKANEQRTSTIKADCSNLSNSTNALKNMLSQLDRRMNNIEDIMGVYIGKEKHRI